MIHNFNGVIYAPNATQYEGDRSMMTKIFKMTTVLAVLVMLGACSTNRIYHESLMRGQIVRAEGDQIVLCIGSNDGADEGMTFNVFNVRYEGSITEGTDNYERKLVGTVSITEVIDGHFARANVMSGKVRLNDMVELHEE
jgi:hypothetical protein